MSKKKEKFNVTQGMSLLLLKKISLPANLVLQMILFITNPENNIILGTRINRYKKTCPKAGSFVRSAQVFPCFHCGGSLLLTI